MQAAQWLPLPYTIALYNPQAVSNTHVLLQHSRRQLQTQMLVLYILPNTKQDKARQGKTRAVPCDKPVQHYPICQQLMKLCAILHRTMPCSAVPGCAHARMLRTHSTPSALHRQPHDIAAVPCHAVLCCRLRCPKQQSNRCLAGPQKPKAKRKRQQLLPGGHWLQRPSCKGDSVSCQPKK